MINLNFNAAIQGLRTSSIPTIKFIIISDPSTVWTDLDAGVIQLIDNNTGLSTYLMSTQPTNATVVQCVCFKSNNYQELGYNQFIPIQDMNSVDPMNFYNLTITLPLVQVLQTLSTTQVG